MAQKITALKKRRGKKLTNSTQSEVSNQHKFLIIANFSACLSLCESAPERKRNYCVRGELLPTTTTKRNNKSYSDECKLAVQQEFPAIFFSFDVSSIFAQTDGGVGSRPVEIFSEKKKMVKGNLLWLALQNNNNNNSTTQV